MWLPDVIVPDGTRVTLRVEPAVARLSRTYRRWTVPPMVLALLPRARRAITRTVQTDVLGDAWVVDVESDSGRTLRISRPTEAEAREVGLAISDRLAREGEAALDAYEN